MYDALVKHVAATLCEKSNKTINDAIKVKAKGIYHISMTTRKTVLS